MSKLKSLMVLAAAPVLELAGLLCDWRRRLASPRYFRVSADYPRFLARGEAAAFCRYHARQFCRGVGIDVGAGRWPFPGAHPVENHPDENAYRLRAADGSQDYVFSSHCLEHLERWPEALAEWRRVLKPGGVLYLYLPHPACRMWNTEVLHHHVWQPEPDTLAEYLAGQGFTIAERSLFPDSYLSFYLVAHKQ